MIVEASRPSVGAIAPLVEQWPHQPFAYCPGIRAEDRVRYWVQLLQAAEERGSVTYAKSENGRLAALLQLEALPWDSGILGMSVGRLSGWLHWKDGGEAASQQVLDAALAEARRRNIRYLLARVPASEMTLVHLLEQAGFQLVDGLLTLGARPEALPAPPPAAADMVCSPATTEDLEELEAIAGQSFSLDRFHADPAIGRTRADAVHRQWIRDSCGGSADQVLVARKGNRVAGFTTLKIDSQSQALLGVKVGTIILVATASAFRRNGIAHLLTGRALEWFRENRCGWVEVGTQLGNIAAARVYLRAGMQPVASSLTYRLLA